MTLIAAFNSSRSVGQDWTILPGRESHSLDSGKLLRKVRVLTNCIRLRQLEVAFGFREVRVRA